MKAATGIVGRTAVSHLKAGFFILVCFAAVTSGARADVPGVPGEYKTNCAACHRDDLWGGQFGPALIGEQFKARWLNRGKDLLDFVTLKMPPGAPGSLSTETYQKLTSYIQRAAGLPVEVTSHQARAPLPADDPHNPPPPAENRDAVFRAAMAHRAALAESLKPIDDEVLAQPSDGDWPIWRRSYEQLGYSPLSDVNTTNVNQLKVAWSWSLKPGTNEIEPLVYQGILFINSTGTVQALEASTGDLIWEYVRPSGQGFVAVTHPRNLALYGTTLFVPTIDGHVIALDARTGKLLWDHQIASDYKVQLTNGPVIVHGKVIQGVAGCASLRVVGGCFVVALDANTGEELWRFNTVARPGAPGGDSWNGVPLEERFGASVWMSGSYDANTGLVYVGTGQTYYSAALLTPRHEPGPKNAALYTDTTLALDPDTGKLVWHYQHFTRDVWDLDWAFERSLIKLPVGGNGSQIAVATIGKMGILDALDAKTGRYLFSYDFGIQNLVKSIDPKTGEKDVFPEKWPVAHVPQTVCPTSAGGRNWPSTAYDPVSHTIYVPMIESCMQYIWDPSAARDSGYFTTARPDGDGNFGRLAALDLVSRKIRWVNRQRAQQSSAILATGGGLVFEGSRDRMFRAHDSATGETLWSTRLDGVPDSYPITFKANGKQYVAVTTGPAMLNFVWAPFTPEFKDSNPATTLWVFELPTRGVH
ncbi:MAG: alcohol dehydrogenase [Rhodospirillaceae bacterium]|nr:MAG: alcohol dehydrogenase [Rhodospirillaceae bacterium]